MGSDSLGQAALPYPLGSEIRVFRDDGGFGRGRWFNRSIHKLQELLVGSYSLPVDEEGDVDLSFEQWIAFAKELVRDHENAVFVYTACGDSVMEERLQQGASGKDA